MDAYHRVALPRPQLFFTISLRFTATQMYTHFRVSESKAFLRRGPDFEEWVAHTHHQTAQVTPPFL